MRRIGKNTIARVILCGAIGGAGAVVASIWMMWDSSPAISALAGLLVMLAAGQLELHRRSARRADAHFARIEERLCKNRDDAAEHYRQIEALCSVYSAIRPTIPLPPMRGYAISPDFAGLLISMATERRPRLVVETGSGVSTLILAYCLRRLGRGRVLALEHDADYAARTADTIRKHNLSDVATVIHAPLTRTRVDGCDGRWYDLSALADHPAIDMLVIDGPPGETQKMARYAALPLLWKCLARDAIILIDDYRRQDERRMVDLWLARYPGLCREVFPTETGAAVLRRGPTSDVQTVPPETPTDASAAAPRATEPVEV